MPLQNRVDPFGEIVAVPERGTMLGNRGVLHDDQRKLVRTSQVRRWICCVLEWKGIRRQLMRPRSYTELFFLDEVTALAAGHRPCFECRRPAALAFQAAWERAFGVKPRADAMDLQLAAERRTRTGGKVTHIVDDAEGLPDGVMIVVDGAAWLLRGGRRWRWSFGGYASPESMPVRRVEVLTPASTVAVLRAGYEPGIHPSAAGARTGSGPT